MAMAKLRTKREQQEYIEQHAHTLARSGKFLNWLEIEHYFRFDEHCPEARQFLDDERIREELDRLCKESQTKQI